MEVSLSDGRVTQGKRLFLWALFSHPHNPGKGRGKIVFSYKHHVGPCEPQASLTGAGRPLQNLMEGLDRCAYKLLRHIHCI